MAAEFLAGPDTGAAIRLHSGDDAVELRVDEDGPSFQKGFTSELWILDSLPAGS